MPAYEASVPYTRSSSVGWPTDSCTCSATWSPSSTTVITPLGHSSARRSAAACSATRGASPAEVEPVDVLPAALAARADMRARVAAHLEDTVACGGAFDPGAALDQLLLDLGALGGEEELVLSLRAHHRLANDDVRARPSLRRLRGIARPSRPARPRTGRARRLCGACRLRARRARAVANACPAAARAKVQARSAASRAPSPESRRSHAKPQAPLTRTRTPIPSLSESASRSTRPFFVATNWLRFGDHACVGVLGPSPGRRIDRGCTEITHRGGL